jgi:hypothetical protein
MTKEKPFEFPLSGDPVQDLQVLIETAEFIIQTVNTPLGDDKLAIANIKLNEALEILQQSKQLILDSKDCMDSYNNI